MNSSGVDTAEFFYGLLSRPSSRLPLLGADGSEKISRYWHHLATCISSPNSCNPQSQLPSKQEKGSLLQSVPSEFQSRCASLLLGFFFTAFSVSHRFILKLALPSGSQPKVRNSSQKSAIL
ncbi:hypothetical protein NPIL_312061 [Nephila pilipes]|uniref:Uncharacterized protein n=1 Tax=Nephila pilipes TaxID=299642 RepID=A0A8X6NRD5_NEPPI|nr:hypothetical protein NPIL_312061 [Nephila pilipes]